MKKTKNILWGIVFIAVGLVIGLNLLGVLEFDLFFRGWWTLFIIIPSAIELIVDKNRKTSLMFLVIGILILLDYQNLFDASIIWKLAVPAALVLIGIRKIIDNIKDDENKPKDTEESVENEPEENNEI